MGFDSRQHRFDEALDRIEGGILPGIGALLEKLLRAAERGEVAGPSACAQELQEIARQIDALTDAMSRPAPDERRDEGQDSDAA